MRAVLFSYAVLVVLCAPLVLRRRWVDRCPRLGILAWQAASLAVVTSLLLAAVLTLSPASRVRMDVNHLLHACADWLHVHDITAVDVGAVIAACLLTVGLCVSAVRSVRSAVQARRHQRELVDLVSVPLRSGVPDEHLLEHATPLAYCIPGGRGRIVVTTGARDALVDDELSAVLAHERAHLRGRHDLVLLASGVLRRVVPVRAFTAAESETAQLVEMLADDALTGAEDRRCLAQAVLALAPVRAAGTLEAGATAHAGRRRVERLLQPRRPLPTVTRRAVLAGLFAVAAAPWLSTAPTLAAALGGCSVLA